MEEELINQIKQYFAETLDIELTPRMWEKGSDLPQYLHSRYRFFQARLLGIDCVFIVDESENEQTPGTVKKHLLQVQSRANCLALYVRASITSYNRKRLIQHSVPFVVPGNQMYLPFLGVDLREHYVKQRRQRHSFRPATQALILHVLYKRRYSSLMPSEMPQHLGYSRMTMTRAFDELKSAGIGKHSNLGRERYLDFPRKGAALWEEVLRFLDSPVRRRFYVTHRPESEALVLSGLSALARYTMMGEPSVPIVAFSAETWKNIAASEEIAQVPYAEPGTLEVEVWKYDPVLFARERTADRLSLYLSMMHDSDERVQSALDELLGGVEW